MYKIKVDSNWGFHVAAIGKTGARKWSELEFCGPQAVEYITSERTKHGSSNSPLEPYIKKNKYITI